MEKIDLIVGYDEREVVAYHVFCQSVIEHTSMPVRFTPLKLSSLKRHFQRDSDGSNAFTYSRFLAPYICGFTGWSIFADGDMVCNTDIAELWQLRDSQVAVQVVKHDYETKARVKYLGNVNESYPRKNWSSLVLWNCAHPSNRVLTPEFIIDKDGAYLHRFKWLADEEIGSLPSTWNWLALEYPEIDNAKIVHYTLGTPCFRDYRDSEMSSNWHAALNRTLVGLEDVD